MNESEIKDKLQEYARTSKNIQYSTKIFEKTEDPNKKPKLLLREVIKDENKKENHFWAVILKYTIDNIPQEVIMGTLGNTNDRKEKAVEIINFIGKQLEENTIPEAGYDYYKELYNYLKTLNIPFKFTMEGLNILANKRKEKSNMVRTYYPDKQGKIQCAYPEEAVITIAEQKMQKLLEEANKMEELGKWRERRKKILNSFNTKEKRQELLKGEGITLFIQETDENIETQKNIVFDYLQEGLEDSSNENPKFKLFKRYLLKKEKGLAIAAKVTLEELEDKYYNEIRKKGGNFTQEELDWLALIKEYGKFFDLVKVGRDWNARLEFSLQIKDFNILKKIFEEKKDKELLEYLDLKEKMINEVKLAEIEVDFNKYDSVKELNKFLINASEREINSSKRAIDYSKILIEGEIEIEEVNEQEFVSQMYEHVKRLIIESNFDSLELYNKYAEKSNRPVCPLPEKKRISKEKYISNIVEKIYEDIKAEALDEPENKDNQNPDNHEQQEGR